MNLSLRITTLALAVVMLATPLAAQPAVARQWNEALLDAIRIDFPAPTVHSRNLYHVSAGMYDAWSVYDAESSGVFYQDKHTSEDTASSRDEAISYAAYRILSERYTHAVDPVASQALFDGLMGSLGYDKNVTTTVGDSPAAIGNRIAQQILTGQLMDGSNEAGSFADDTGYLPVNTPMLVDHPTVTGPQQIELSDPNRWQPLFLESSFTQNGLQGENLQEYIGPHWGNVTTFAMGRGYNPGANSWSKIDPGPPPKLGGAGDAEFRDYSQLLIEYSNALDPNQGVGAETINISPNTTGNRPLGTHDDQGYANNPSTGMPYADNFVRRADYGRVLAEFWADGPKSETPPGHWNVLANEVSEHSQLEKRIGGSGPLIDDLQWDVKLYLALNGAVHDSAVAAWGAKREYDYVRPITIIRYMGSLGQSSDVGGTSYHPDGLELVPDMVELITTESIADGGRHRNAYLNANELANGLFLPDLNYSEAEMVGKVVVHAWNHEPDDPLTEVSGIDWILAENWVPYQQDNFVTPAFAAYVSGHSTFSRAAAEVLAAFTGSEYFPGGLGELTFDTSYLDFELGPSSNLTLQWATYFDAADEAGISRLHGGIHVPPDDFAGRIMGSSIGIDAYDAALKYFAGIANPFLLGDFNFDGAVDASDAGVMFGNWGTDGVSDINEDGVVDAADASILFANWTGDPNPVHSVPEPVSYGLTGLLGLAICGLGIRRP